MLNFSSDSSKTASPEQGIEQVLSSDSVADSSGDAGVGKPVVRPITAALDIMGWAHLDAILLAALATESPVLLIGPHGTAKTLLVERLAQALDMTFRHYNASLINYDDLVGIPIPEEGHLQLRFITTPGAIWDAEFVFFDEISRCRPDLQNKLFPVIHERRVVGMRLEKLRLRWAAMNPPSPDNPDIDANASDFYLGSEPLDPALTDRFPFVVPVPNWRDLSREARRQLVAFGAVDALDTAVRETPFTDYPLAQMVADCVAWMPRVEAECSAWITDYILCIMDLLEKANLTQSPRRARMLSRSIVAVHAARIVLSGDEDIDLATSAELAVLYGLPQTATEVPPAAASVVAIHKQAWEITSKLDDDAWRQVLEEVDPVKRVVLADDLQFDDEDMSRLVTQALGSDDSQARQMGLATVIFLAFRHRRRLTPAAYEPLVNLSRPVLQPRTGSETVNNNDPDMTIWNEIKPWAIKRRNEGDAIAMLEVNYVLGGFPEMWRQYNWRESLTKFKEDLKLFGVKELN